jgi:hypothetical protein
MKKDFCPLHRSCPKCKAKDGLIWHPKPGVGWYCHECGEGFVGPPDLHDILRLVKDVGHAQFVADCDPGQLDIALGALYSACKILKPAQWKRRGKV